MVDVLAEMLPELYDRWARALLGGQIERETQAPCNNCVMCRPKASGDTGLPTHNERVYFNSETKCCTFVPWLPNFLVGRILSDEDAAAHVGRRSVEERLRQAIGVSPMGLTPPAVFSVLYRESTESFGRSRKLRCPHYIEANGGCGIWKNRNSICSTWFCKHVRGARGNSFWRSLQSTLDAVELDIARWAILDLNPQLDDLEHIMATRAWQGREEELTGASIDLTVDNDEYQKVWGAWFGREREFFRECAEKVNELSWSDVTARCGPGTRALALQSARAYRELRTDDIPHVLVPGPYSFVSRNNGHSLIDTYRGYDPLEVPDILLNVLSAFDGRNTKDAMKAIASEHNVTLQDDLLRKLVDFRVLVPLTKK
jgi:hypothetical protein